MVATDVFKFIEIGAAVIALVFGVVAGMFAFKYRREILRAEIHRARASQMRVKQTQIQQPKVARESEREPAHVG